MNIDSLLGCRLFQKLFLSGIWVFLIFCSKLNLPLPQQSAEIQIVHSWRSIKSQQQSSCLPSKSLIVPSFTPTKSPNSSIFVDETRKSSVNHCETTIFRCFNSRYLTARHEKIHHAIKFGKPGKPSISMGHGLTMAMLKNQRVYIYIWWEDYDGWSFWEDYDGWSKNGFPK